MTEDQRKWLLNLQSKGVKFEIFHPDYGWENGSYTLRFCGDPDTYRIHAQPIPDIPDWREVCAEMQSRGIYFYHQDVLDKHCVLGDFREYYSIKRQPLPEWREEMTEETKPDPRDEIPHHELQVQWHEDKLHSLRTREPMREWERRSKLSNVWMIVSVPEWRDAEEYRRKPRTVTYWHCVVMFDGLKSEVITGYCKDEVSDQIKCYKEAYPDAKFGPIIETTVEIELVEIKRSND